MLQQDQRDRPQSMNEVIEIVKTIQNKSTLSIKKTSGFSFERTIEFFIRCCLYPFIFVFSNKKMVAILGVIVFVCLGIFAAMLNLLDTNSFEVFKDSAKTVASYRKAAEQGDAEAQFNLGKCYQIGNGVSQDYAEAVKWYRKAAEQENAKAQNNLGVCYVKGEGVSQDHAEAVKWYRKAAEQGYANAQYNLGLCYENGQGVSQDNAEAIKWYRKSAEQGYEDAKKNLDKLLR
jgi:TPR repeat protein